MVTPPESIPTITCAPSVLVPNAPRLRLQKLKMLSRRNGLVILIAATILLFSSLFFIPPIPQPQSHHNFADQRSWHGIPNFGDVISNLPFAIFGAMGLLFLASRSSKKSFLERERWPYVFVFLGLFLTAFGSGYYHLSPSNATLLWDRLPMTIAFMGIVAALISERISVAAGVSSLPLLLLVGAASPVHWYLSEIHGHGDLRFYAAVQAAAVLALPLFLLLFPPRYTRSSDFVIVACFYVLAKLLEALDKQILSALGDTLSGHTLKHVAASVSGYWILRMLKLRRPLNARTSS
jgi:hypothetical protein